MHPNKRNKKRHFRKVLPSDKAPMERGRYKGTDKRVSPAFMTVRFVADPSRNEKLPIKIGFTNYQFILVIFPITYLLNENMYKEAVAKYRWSSPADPKRPVRLSAPFDSRTVHGPKSPSAAGEPIKGLHPSARIIGKPPQRSANPARHISKPLGSHLAKLKFFMGPCLSRASLNKKVPKRFW
jgi:hypothetical protein